MPYNSGKRSALASAYALDVGGSEAKIPMAILSIVILLSFFCIPIFGFLTYVNAKEDYDDDSLWLKLNPIGVVGIPEALTSRGRLFQKLMYASIAVFILSFLLGNWLK